MFYIGTQGIPASVRLKNGNVIDGLYTLSSLSLNALELDFVYGIYLDNEECEIVKRVAKRLGIRLSIHAPYYINLLSDKEVVIKRSKERILKCIERGSHLDADIIAIHAAYYGNLTKEEAYNRVKKELKSIIEIDNRVKIGVETMAKVSQFGTFDEVIRLYDEIGVYPYIDFAHIFARNNGKIDYKYILDTLEDRKIEHIYSHFEGLKIKNGKYVDVHAPIGDPPFEPLAIELVKRKCNITIICESPLLELDCIKMKKILEEVSINK